jgi:pyridoxamine 5'-phosphate oxidase
MAARSASLRSIAALRTEYQSSRLLESSVSRSPFVQFKRWFSDAVRAALVEPNAMVLATVSDAGSPSARAVLMKRFDAQGVLFFTNYGSKKGRDISRNPRVAALFLWKDLERQIRIEGVARKLSRAASVRYFRGRPREAQLGAWASPQSERIPDRATLQRRLDRVRKQFEGRTVPCPPHWGGYVIEPRHFEFWQGREGRLHDRIVYRSTKQVWKIFRVAP